MFAWWFVRGGMLSTPQKGIKYYSNIYRNEKGPKFGKGHFRASKGQKPTWVPLFKCVFVAFQAKQIFHDFLKEGMRPNVGRIKCSDKGLFWHRCFPVDFAKYLKTPFLQNTSGGYFWICLILELKFDDKP